MPANDVVRVLFQTPDKLLPLFIAPKEFSS